jgi:hypothetical protein
MCKAARKAKRWSSSKRVSVGDIVEPEDPYILVSEGQSQSQAAVFALWWPQTGGTPHLIDRLKQGGKGNWSYTREYECYDPACIATRFLEILNPQFQNV